MNEFWPQERLTPHQRQHTAPIVVQPVDGATGYIFSHALDFVVIGPAVPAIEVALVFDKQIGGDRVELARKYSRSDIGKQPSS